jgi:site-specific recombinase XerD
MITQRAADWLSQFLEYLRGERGASANTIATYRLHLERFIAFLKLRRKSPKSASRADIRKFLTYLFDSGLTASGVANRYAAVCSFYRFMRYSGAISAVPHTGIRAPKIHQKLVEQVLDADVEKLIAHLAAQPETALMLRDRAILQTFYDSGLRVSELTTLKSSDLQFTEADRAMRVIGKGDKERLVPMSPPQAGALKAYLERGRSALMGEHPPEHEIVFVGGPRGRNGTAQGSPLTRERVFQIIQRLGRTVLGRSIHPHQLRHSFGTTLIQHGADPRNVQALMGHADINTTMRYCHVDLRMIKEVHSKTHPRG